MKANFLIIVLFIFSCSKENPNKYQINDSNEIEGIFNYINANLGVNQETHLNKDIVIVYLILKECNCIYENVDFIKDFININSNKKMFLIVKPGDTERYTKEMTELNLLKSENFEIIVDKEDDFLKHGNFYVSDKFFIINNFKTIDKIELKKDNFNIILEELI